MNYNCAICKIILTEKFSWTDSQILICPSKQDHAYKLVISKNNSIQIEEICIDTYQVVYDYIKMICDIYSSSSREPIKFFSKVNYLSTDKLISVEQIQNFLLL